MSNERPNGTPAFPDDPSRARVYDRGSDRPAQDHVRGLDASQHEHGAPVALTARYSGLAAGGAANFDTNSLQPGVRCAYIIDEVRFALYAADVNTTTGDMASICNVDFKVGSRKVTNKPMPLSLLCPVWGYREIFPFQRDAGGEGASNGLCANYRWPLPKPLMLDPGDVLVPIIYRDQTVGASDSNIDIEITYIGRQFAPGYKHPSVRPVPYAAHYVHHFAPISVDVATGNGGYVESSSDAEFQNPFLIPLQVQRLTARHRFTSAANGITGIVTAGNFPVEAGLIGLPNSALNAGLSPYTTFRITDSLGYAVVPTMSPVGDVIDPYRAAWTFSRPLPGREKFTMDFSTLVFDTDVGSTNGTGDTMIGLIGYREEIY